MFTMMVQQKLLQNEQKKNQLAVHQEVNGLFLLYTGIIRGGNCHESITVRENFTLEMFTKKVYH